MADEQKKVTLLDFQVRDSDVLERIGEVKKEVRALREANKELGRSFGENAVEIARNEVKLSELGKEERNLKAITEQSAKAAKARTGSIVQMRAEYANLKKQYDQLSKAERDAADNGQVMARLLEDMADQINEANKQAGSFKDNIGRYPGVLKEAARGVNLFGVNVGQVSDNLKSGAQGFGGYVKGIDSAKTALVALTVVPVVLVLTAIVALLAKLASATDFVGDKFGQFTAGVGGAFDFLASRLNEFLNNFDFSKVVDGAIADFKALAEIGSRSLGFLLTGKPEKALENLGRLGETNLGRLAAGAARAAQQAANLARELQDLEDAENANRVAVAESDAATTKALIQIKNRNLALKDKIAILDAASAKEAAAAEEELRIARQRERIAAQEIAAGRTQDASQEKLQAAKIARINAERDTVNIQEKIANRRAALLEAEMAARLAASEKAYQIEKTNAERAAQLARDEMKLFDIAAKDELRTAKKNGEDLEVLRRLQGQRRIELQRKISDGLAAAEKELADKLAGFRKAEEEYDADQQQKQAGNAKKLLETAMEDSSRRFAELSARRSEQVAAGELSEEEAALRAMAQRRLQMEAELELERNHAEAVAADAALTAQTREELLRESSDRQVAMRQKLADAEVAIQRRSAEDQKKIQQANFQVAEGFVAGMGSLFEILASDQEEAVRLQKVSALAQIAIDTAKAISALVAASSANPANSVTFGAAGAVQFATGIAQILANIAQARQLLASFEQGGLVDTARGRGVTLKGRRHRDGGTRIFIEGTGWIEAEAGEVLTIVKRTDSAKLGRLSAENERRGGRAFYETGGAMTLNAAAALSEPAAIDYDRLARAVAAQPAPIVRVTDLNRVQGNVARIQNRNKI